MTTAGWWWWWRGRLISTVDSQTNIFFVCESTVIHKHRRHRRDGHSRYAWCRAVVGGGPLQLHPFADGRQHAAPLLRSFLHQFLSVPLLLGPFARPLAGGRATQTDVGRGVGGGLAAPARHGQPLSAPAGRQRAVLPSLPARRRHHLLPTAGGNAEAGQVGHGGDQGGHHGGPDVDGPCTGHRAAAPHGRLGGGRAADGGDARRDDVRALARRVRAAVGGGAGVHALAGVAGGWGTSGKETQGN